MSPLDDFHSGYAAAAGQKIAPDDGALWFFLRALSDSISCERPLHRLFATGVSPVARTKLHGQFAWHAIIGDFFAHRVDVGKSR